MEFVNLKLGNLHKSAETAAATAAPEAEQQQQQQKLKQEQLPAGRFSGGAVNNFVAVN